MRDYRVDVKIRNGRFLGALDKIGMSPSAFAKEYGFSTPDVCGIAAMKFKPTYANGDWKPCVMKLAELAGVMPDDMFTAEQRGTITKNTVTMDVSKAELIENFGPGLAISDARPLDKIAEQSDIMRIVNECISSLEPRHQIAFMGIYASGRTMEDVARQLGVTRERVRQMSLKSRRTIQRKARIELGCVGKDVLGNLFEGEAT